MADGKQLDTSSTLVWSSLKPWLVAMQELSYLCRRDMGRANSFRDILLNGCSIYDQILKSCLPPMAPIWQRDLDDLYEMTLSTTTVAVLPQRRLEMTPQRSDISLRPQAGKCMPSALEVLLLEEVLMS